MSTSDKLFRKGLAPGVVVTVKVQKSIADKADLASVVKHLNVEVFNLTCKYLHFDESSNTRYR